MSIKISSRTHASKYDNMLSSFDEELDVEICDEWSKEFVVKFEFINDNNEH